MPSQDLQKNLPHMIAIGVLILALLVVATKTGLVACSSLGDSYCDMYYSMLGKPTVLIIRGDDGMGSPDVLARMIEDQHQLPVQKLRVDQISKGNIADYNVIIVEHAREIPTEKLKVFYDYLFEDMGRLVWVGDAGTIGSANDETCRLMEFTVQWTAEDGTHKEDYEENICVKESELTIGSDSASFEIISTKRDALLEKSFEHIDELCIDAFEGKLGVAESKGYECKGASFGDVYFKWTNEANFRANVNPWSRGEYEKLTTEGKQSGIDFADTVLGVGFVADDYAVAEFDMYYTGIDEVKENLIKAHAGFVACSRSLEGTVCNIAAKGTLIKGDLTTLNSYQDNAETTLSGVVTTLNSIAQQKTIKNESSYEVTVAATRIESDIDEIKVIEIPDEMIVSSEITAIEKIGDILGDSREELVQLRGAETDTTIKNNYGNHIASLESIIASLETKIGTLREHLNEYNECSAEEIQGMSTMIAAETGYIEELEQMIAYSSPLIDENGAVDFIRQAKGQRWEALGSKLKSISLDCGGEEFTLAMTDAGNAIEIAQSVDTTPGEESEALATMQVADIKHPLVNGITRTKDLTNDGLPVPFVLVETNAVDSHEVIQLRVAPAYRGINTWPGITVKDPKFASHTFGKGVVVYYAFPPETDEVFVKNLIDFLLY